MARPSLKANVAKKQEEEKAVAIARALSAPAPAAADQDVDHETVSYHLPVDLIELIREALEAYRGQIEAEIKLLKG